VDPLTSQRAQRASGSFTGAFLGALCVSANSARDRPWQSPL